MSLEQFGVSVSGLSHSGVHDLGELNLDIIQVPLHRGLPDEYVIDMLADSDTHICGKLVPDPQVHDARFFRALFRRYKGRIKLWDFGGEPETRPHQSGCRWSGSAGAFVALFRQFRNEAKAVDPDNVVGAGGFLAPTFNGLFGNESRFGFLRELFSEGIGYGLDFASINLYSAGYGGQKNFVAGTLLFRELLASYRCSSVPMVVSECGVPCGGDPKFLHIIQTPERQAESLVTYHLICCALGVDYTIWYTFRDPAWGLIDMQGLRRPAYGAFKNMIRVLKGCIFKKTLKAFPSRTLHERWCTDSIYWYVLARPDGQEIHVVWAEELVMLQRGIPSAVSGSCDIYGSAIPGCQFLLDSSPKYFAASEGALHSGNFLVE